MNKLLTIILGSLLLSGCTVNTDDIYCEKLSCNFLTSLGFKKDIYSFTKEFDSKKQPDIDLTAPQKKSVDEIIEALTVFEAQYNPNNNSKNNPKLIDYAKQHNWDIKKLAENPLFWTEYWAKLKDNSNIELSFRYRDFFGLIFNLEIQNLTTKQCNYLIDHYKYINPNFKAQVFIGSYDTTCEKFDNNPEHYTITVKIENDVKTWSNEYKNFSAEIVSLMKNDYDHLISTYKTKIYFTDKDVSTKILRNGADYIVNKKDNSITMGYLSKERCKNIVYSLPESIKYKVENNCNNQLNNITFFK